MHIDETFSKFGEGDLIPTN